MTIDSAGVTGENVVCVSLCRRSNMSIKDKVVAVLHGLGIQYELFEIDPSKSDTAAFCEAYGSPIENAANSILIASKKNPPTYCLCVGLATTQLDINRKVKELMGSRVSFAKMEEMTTMTGMEFGAVTPFGLPQEIPVYIDQRVMTRDWVIIGAGVRSHKIKLSPNAFSQLPNVSVISDLAKLRSSPL